MSDNDQNEAKSKPQKAISLEYDIKKDLAPRITATGKGEIAEQILAIAKEHNIPIHKDTELADILEVLGTDSVIPLEAYATVAEILSYTYKLNNNKNEDKDD